jgi:chlorobactene glucosyltransferase
MNLLTFSLPSQLAGVVIFLTVLLLVALSNLWAFKRLEAQAARQPRLEHGQRVSILVPARDEEKTIVQCIKSLLAQDYPNFEVLALDDHSQDHTIELLDGLAAQNGRLRVLQGQALPPGWLGKHWACHQLVEAASGELLLFTDADTRHHPQALREAVSVLVGERADFLCAWPRQEVLTWGERLVVPLIYWAFFTFVPLALAYRTRITALTAAIGQFMLIRRTAYEQVGGYAAVRNHTADDLALARRVKAAGLRWLALDGGNRVSCRMYTSFGQAFQGVSKNLFPAFDYRLLPFIFVWTWLGVVFLEPLVVLVTAVLGGPLPPSAIRMAGLAGALALLLWSLALGRLRFPRWIALAYPLIMALAVMIAFRSLALNLAGKATWKGRALERPAIRWF